MTPEVWFDYYTPHSSFIVHYRLFWTENLEPSGVRLIFKDKYGFRSVRNKLNSISVFAKKTTIDKDVGNLRAVNSREFDLLNDSPQTGATSS